jgi:hypothetical protein
LAPRSSLPQEAERSDRVNGLDPSFSPGVRRATSACSARNLVIAEISGILDDGGFFIVSNLPLATKLLFFNPPFISKETRVASKAKKIGSTDRTQPGTAVEEREPLLHSTQRRIQL